jgi:hypothetical protein
MKVSNSKTPANANDGVSRETLNKWQREDSSKPGKERGPHKEGDPKDVGKQAEG